MNAYALGLSKAAQQRFLRDEETPTVGGLPHNGVIQVGLEMGYPIEKLVDTRSGEYLDAMAVGSLMKSSPHLAALGVEATMNAMENNPRLRHMHYDKAMDEQFGTTPYEQISAGITEPIKPWQFTPTEVLARQDLAREKQQGGGIASQLREQQYEEPIGPPLPPQQTAEDIENMIAAWRGGQQQHAAEGPQQTPVAPHAIRGHVKGTYDPEKGFQLNVTRGGKTFSMGGRVHGQVPYQGPRKFEWGAPKRPPAGAPKRPPAGATAAAPKPTTLMPEYTSAPPSPAQIAQQTAAKELRRVEPGRRTKFRSGAKIPNVAKLSRS